MTEREREEEPLHGYEHHEKILLYCARKLIKKWRREGKTHFTKEEFDEAVYKSYQKMWLEECKALVDALVAKGILEIYVQDGQEYVRRKK